MGKVVGKVAGIRMLKYLKPLQMLKQSSKI
jgi:hypothetical protein